MNYLQFRKNILATIQLKAELFSAIISVNGDLSSAVVNLNTIRLAGKASNAVKLYPDVDVLGTIHFEVDGIETISDVVVKDVVCPQVSPIIVDNITSVTTQAVKMLIANTEKINGIISSLSNNNAVLYDSEVIAFKPLLDIKTSTSAVLEAWSSWTEFGAKLDIVSRLTSIISIIEPTIVLGASQAIFEGSMNLKTIDGERISGIIDVEDNVEAVISLIRRALMKDYEGTIDENFYNKTIKDSWYITIS